MREERLIIDCDMGENVEELLGRPRTDEELWDEELCKKLWGAELTGWHVTRLLDVSEVADKGLRAYDMEEGLDRIIQALDRIELTDEQRAATIASAAAYLERDENRRGVNFFSLERDVLEGEYYRFGKTYGGETLRWALEGVIDGAAYEKLAIGTPWRVNFRYPFTALAESTKSRVLTALRKCLEGEMESPRFDGYLIKDVPPERILRVLPLEMPAAAE